MALFKHNGKELKRFDIGDLVYDEYYGTVLLLTWIASLMKWK